MRHAELQRGHRPGNSNCNTRQRVKAPPTRGTPTTPSQDFRVLTIALLDIVGPEVTEIMLETQIPNAIELQTILRGEMIPGAEETIRSYVTRRYESEDTTE